MKERDRRDERVRRSFAEDGDAPLGETSRRAVRPFGLEHLGKERSGVILDQLLEEPGPRHKRRVHVLHASSNLRKHRLVRTPVQIDEGKSRRELRAHVERLADEPLASHDTAQEREVRSQALREALLRPDHHVFGDGAAHGSLFRLATIGEDSFFTAIDENGAFSQKDGGDRGAHLAGRFTIAQGERVPGHRRGVRVF